MTDVSGRRVSVRAQSRSVALDSLVPQDVFTYPGIVVQRWNGGILQHQSWLPVGDDEPSLADDEQLITTLRNALRWETTAA